MNAEKVFKNEGVDFIIKHLLLPSTEVKPPMMPTFGLLSESARGEIIRSTVFEFVKISNVAIRPSAVMTTTPTEGPGAIDIHLDFDYSKLGVLTHKSPG